MKMERIFISRILYFFLLVLTSKVLALNNENSPIFNNEGCKCNWTEWMNNQNYDPLVGDNNSFNVLRQNYVFCEKPDDIQCRDKWNPEIPFSIAGQPGINCDVTQGLTCTSRPVDFTQLEPEKPFYCHDYKIRVLCCTCPTTTTESTTTATTTTKTITTVPLELMNDLEPGVYNTTAPHTTLLQRNNFFVYIIIIVVIVAGVIIILGLILYFARNKKYPKHVHEADYMAADMYDFQRRPVSFTDVDRHSLNSTSSLTTPSSGSYTSAQAKFSRSKLEFVGGQEEPDVIVSTRHNDVTDQPKWFPDEHEVPTRQMGKKLLFGRAFAPAQRNPPYMDDEQM